jgi:hypothetical protein
VRVPYLRDPDVSGNGAPLEGDSPDVGAVEAESGCGWMEEEGNA